jgi:hypothetical protein
MTAAGAGSEVRTRTVGTPGDDYGFPGADAVVVDGRRTSPAVGPRECIVAGLRVVVSTTDHDDVQVLIDGAVPPREERRLVRTVELDVAMDACYARARAGSPAAALTARVGELTAELGPDAVRVAADGLLPRATA